MPTYMTRLRLLLVVALLALPLLAHAGDVSLRYHANAWINELQVGECVARPFKGRSSSGETPTSSSRCCHPAGPHRRVRATRARSW